jgi:hypothetical protein
MTDVPSPTEQSKLSGASTCLSIALGNKYVATGSDRGQLLVWSLKDMVRATKHPYEAVLEAKIFGSFRDAPYIRPPSSSP